MQYEQFVPTGVLAARYIKALATGNDWSSRISYVERQTRWSNRSTVVNALKAAVAPITSTEFSTALAPISNDLVELLRPHTLLGRMQGVVTVPLKTRLITQTGGTTAHWVGEASAKPMSAAAFAAVSELSKTKVSAIAIITRELLDNSDPAADELLARDVSRAMAEALDTTLIDPSNFGSAGIRPASVTSGGTLISSSGSTVAAIDNDLRALINVLANADSDFLSAYFVMHGQTAGYLSSLRDVGSLAYPGMGVRNGFLLGIPVLTTSAVVTVNSPGERFISLIDAGSVLSANTEAVVDISTQAAVQMSDTPGSGAQNLVSLFQNNLVGVRGEVFASFALRRAGGSATLTDVAY